jgi:hypothetical protein
VLLRSAGAPAGRAPAMNTYSYSIHANCSGWLMESQLTILLDGPGWDGVDDVDHHLVEGGVDLVLGFGAGVA